MRTVAAIPALGLLAGSAAGLLAPDGIRPLASTLLMCGTGAAVWAWRTSSARTVVWTTAAVFAAGGALLAADAWQTAWRSTLRLAFEELARDDRAQAARERRVLPEDDEAYATVEGVLREDAARTESGVVSLSVAVAAIQWQEEMDGREGQAGAPAAMPAPPARQPHWGPGWGPSASEKIVGQETLRPVQGGLLVTVVGSLGPSSIDEWRAGRRVRMPVQLHRPSRYLDPGVSDSERMLARSGTTLVGSVKSGALVERIDNGPWWSEAAGGVRLFARRAITRSVGRGGRSPPQS